MPLWGWSLVACGVLALGNYVQFGVNAAIRTDRDMAKDRVAELEQANKALEQAEADRAKEIAALRRRSNADQISIARTPDTSGCFDADLPADVLRLLRTTTETPAPDAGAKAHPRVHGEDLP